jgi:hypothetical protein
MSKRAILVLSSAFILMSFAPVQSLGAPPVRQQGKKDIQELLRAEVVAQKPKLGALLEWQGKVFDEEIALQHQRFVRDFRPGGTGVIADIDLTTMKSYLAWGAAEGLQGEAAKVDVWLSAEEGCDKCQAALAPMKKVVKARLERRGYTPVFLEASALGGGKMTGAHLNERLSEVARKKGHAGALMLQWQQAPVDPDSPHADETHYLLRVWQMARSDASGEMKHEGALELLENDSLVQGFERLLSDAATLFGSRVLASRETGADDPSLPELRITLTGVRDWSHYAELRNRLQTSLKATGAVEEREVSRGRADFAVKSRKPASEISSAVSGALGDGVSFKVEGP